MKLEIIDIEKFIKVNELQEIKNPIYTHNGNYPTEDGLFSHEIFGSPGTTIRKEKWAFIDLKDFYLHPIIYKTCMQLDRKFAEIISGTRYVSIVDGLIEDDENGWTGLSNLYKNWESIIWEKRASRKRNTRIELLKGTTKKLAFINKWLVLPAGYRDITNTGSTGMEVSAENPLYVKLLLAQKSSITSGFNIIDGFQKYKIQETLLELQDYMMEKVIKKKGLIQDRLLGKYVDYAIQGVISSPNLSFAEKPENIEVPFGTLGIPLHLLLNLYYPFVIHYLNNLFSDVENGVTFLNVGGKGFTIPKEIANLFGSELYKKWISRCLKSQEARLELLSIETKTGEPFIIPYYDSLLGRPTTLLDLFYIAISSIIKDKYVLFTRFPITGYASTHFAKPVILTTVKTEEKQIFDNIYTNYPVITNTPPVWVDSIRLHNSYTEAMGADYDGDRIRVIGLFSKDSNLEAEKTIKSPSFVLDVDGTISRSIQNEGVLGLYSLTK